MEFQSNINPSKNPEVLRSNSIKAQNRNLHGGFSFRLNSKKFPVDFFGKDAIHSLKHQLIPLPQRMGSKTERKTSACLGNEFIPDERLPEAQITSFFKICQDSSDTTDTTALKNQGFSNETNIGVSDLQCIITKQISTSIQLNAKYEANPDLCLTFSKIPVSRSKFTTPEKKRVNIQTKADEHKNESSQSVRARRPLSKLETRIFNMPVSRKNSIQKVFSLKTQTENKQIRSARLVKNLEGDQLFLPTIGKNYV